MARVGLQVLKIHPTDYINQGLYHIFWGATPPLILEPRNLAAAIVLLPAISFREHWKYEASTVDPFI